MFFSFQFHWRKKHALFSLYMKRILYTLKVSSFLRQAEKRVHVLIYFISPGVPNMHCFLHPENRVHVLLFYYGKNSLSIFTIKELVHSFVKV